MLYRLRQLSNVNREKHKSHRVCGRDRQPSRIPIQNLKQFGTRALRLENLPLHVVTQAAQTLNKITVLHNTMLLGQCMRK